MGWDVPIVPGDVVACVGGALLAEAWKPAESWRKSVVNIAMGIFAGTFGPQGIEVAWERLERCHRLLIAICSLAGASVIQSFLAWSARKSFDDWLGIAKKAFDMFRKSPAPSAEKPKAPESTGEQK